MVEGDARYTSAERAFLTRQWHLSCSVTLCSPKPPVLQANDGADGHGLQYELNGSLFQELAFKPEEGSINSMFISEIASMSVI